MRKTFYEREGLVARRYDSCQFWEARYHNKRMKHVLKILKYVMERNKCIFLDAGCGTGEYLFFASNRKTEVLGIDISLTYLKRVKRWCRNAQLIQSSIENLPFKNSCIGIILCSEVIEHLPQVNLAISELYRVACNNVIVTTPNYGLLRRVLAKVARSYLEKKDREVGHISIFDTEKLLEKLSKEGWRVNLLGTLHIVPPALAEKLHLPRALSMIVDLVELLLNKLLPNLGNITLIYCRRLRT